MLLSHSGLGYTSEVSNWISKNTRSGLSRVLKDTSNSNFFTRRNSAKTALFWREQITIQNVQEVQKVCKKDMEILNYILVKDQINKSTTVIKPFNFT